MIASVIEFVTVVSRDVMSFPGDSSKIISSRENYENGIFCLFQLAIIQGSVRINLATASSE